MSQPRLRFSFTALALISLLGACAGDPDDAGAATDTSAAEADGGGAADGATGADSGSDAGEDAGPAPEPLPELTTTGVLADSNPDPKVVEVTLTAAVHKRTLFDGAPELDMYLYNGQFPGPTLHARVGDQVIVHFKNDLPEKTTVHWHGLRIPDDMDGSPRIQDPVQPGGTFTYSFVVPEAGTFWYHPHVRSNEQVEKGLQGAIVVHEAEAIDFTRERVQVLDDIYLTEDGYGPWLASHPEVMHGRHGNILLLNGERTPAAPVQAQSGDVERWRVVNTANARTMRLSFVGPAFVRVIGTDGGLIAEPFDLEGPLDVAVGQRYDLEVAYHDEGVLQLRQLVPSGGMGWTPHTMIHVEVAANPKGPGVLTPTLPEVAPIPDVAPSRTVKMVFDAVQSPSTPGGVLWRINGKAHWSEPIFTFEEGETVLIDISNELGPSHPFHLHGQFFQVLQRNGKPADEPGLKDTAIVGGMGTLRLKATMTNPGQWMAHCHILEHAEIGMMGDFVVTPKGD